MILRRPIQTTLGTIHHRRILLLKATGEFGEVWAECSALDTPDYLPETIDTAILALSKWLIPLVLNHAFESPNALNLALNRQVRGHHFAKATLEMAGWAAYSLSRGEPLARTLGGSYRTVKSGIVLGHNEQSQVNIETALAEGYHRIKIKLSGTSDLQLIRSIRAMIPLHIQMTADANGSVSDPNVLHAIDQIGMDLLEQPCAWNEIVPLPTAFQTPICLDESIQCLSDMRMAIALNACQSVCIKPGKLGGFAPALAVFEAARSHGISGWVGGMFETGIGRAYNLALASVVQSEHVGDFSPGARYWEADCVQPPTQMMGGGVLSINWDRPGLGVDLDPAVISQLVPLLS